MTWHPLALRTINPIPINWKVKVFSYIKYFECLLLLHTIAVLFLNRQKKDYNQYECIHTQCVMYNIEI